MNSGAWYSAADAQDRDVGQPTRRGTPASDRTYARSVDKHRGPQPASALNSPNLKCRMAIGTRISDRSRSVAGGHIPRRFCFAGKPPKARRLNHRPRQCDSRLALNTITPCPRRFCFRVKDNNCVNLRIVGNAHQVMIHDCCWAKGRHDARNKVSSIGGSACSASFEIPMQEKVRGKILAFASSPNRAAGNDYGRFGPGLRFRRARDWLRTPPPDSLRASPPAGGAAFRPKKRPGRLRCGCAA